MITEGSIKTPEQIVSMKHACKIVAEALMKAESHLVVGATTRDVDDFLRHFIENEGAKPAFLGLYGFPATINIIILNLGSPSPDVHNFYPLIRYSYPSASSL